MKKKYIAALAAGVAASAWCVHRDWKYPVRRELRFANKLAVPGWTLNLKTAGMANQCHELKLEGTLMQKLPSVQTGGSFFAKL